MLVVSLLLLVCQMVSTSADDTGRRRMQTISTSPITIHVPFPKNQEASDTPVSSPVASEADTEGSYLIPITEHRREKEVQPINLMLNLRLLMDREEKKPEQTEGVTVITEPSPQPAVKENSPDYVARPIKILDQNANINVSPTQRVPAVVSPPNVSNRISEGVVGTDSDVPRVSTLHRVVPSYILVPKRPVVHNVRSILKTDVPRVPLAQFRRKLLSEHNKKRLLHGVPPLTLDQKLNREAQKFVNYLAAQKNATHSLLDSRKGEGENIAVRCSLKGSPLPEARTADLWYDEGKRFNWTSPSVTKATGHFTQMVWKDTTKAGFGRARFTDKEGRACFVVVARYAPLGNIEGKLADNVLKPRASTALLQILNRRTPHERRATQD